MFKEGKISFLNSFSFHVIFMGLSGPLKNENGTRNIYHCSLEFANDTSMTFDVNTVNQSYWFHLVVKFDVAHLASLKFFVWDCSMYALWQPGTTQKREGRMPEQCRCSA